MDLATILGLIRAATATAESLAPLIDQVRTVLSSEDQGEVDSALNRLQAANDQLHERLQNKLASAAQSS